MLLKVYFLETRPQYLLLPIVLVFLGTSVAWQNMGSLHAGYAALALFGLLLVHISANVLNDYFDFKSGIDLAVTRSPFNGGSGILPASLLTPRQVLVFGLAAFALAIPIGIYFVLVTGLALVPLLLVGGLCALLYTPMLAKAGLPEWAPGVGLGTLPILGAFFVQTGQYTLPAVVASIPPGFLVLNLLLLNEFPDVEADRGGGRKTLPIMGGRGVAAAVYSTLTIAVYVWIVGGVLLGAIPAFCLLAMLTVPFAVQAIQGACRFAGDHRQLLPAMRANVLVVLLTQLLMGIGYILAGLF